MISFFVPGLPVAQPRHKVGKVGGFARAYIEAKHPVHDWKAVIKLAAARSGKIDGAIVLRLAFVFPRPQGMVWKKRLMPRAWHTKKPDSDNLAKAVKDGLNSITWDDDSQVADLRVTKVIGAFGEPTGVHIEIESAEPIGEPT